MAGSQCSTNASASLVSVFISMYLNMIKFQNRRTSDAISTIYQILLQFIDDIIPQPMLKGEVWMKIKTRKEALEVKRKVSVSQYSVCLMLFVGERDCGGFCCPRGLP